MVNLLSGLGLDREGRRWEWSLFGPSDWRTPQGKVYLQGQQSLAGSVRDPVLPEDDPIVRRTGFEAWWTDVALLTSPITPRLRGRIGSRPSGVRLDLACVNGKVTKPCTSPQCQPRTID
jgi:hypothetical protein